MAHLELQIVWALDIMLNAEFNQQQLDQGQQLQAEVMKLQLVIILQDWVLIQQQLAIQAQLIPIFMGS